MVIPVVSGKIVLFINTLGSGGAQRQIILLARELDAKGYEVVVLHYGDSSHMAYMLDGSNVAVKHVKATGKGKPLMLFSVLVGLLRQNPTYLISFIDTPNLVASLAKLLKPSLTWVASERNLVVGSSRKERLWRRFSYLGASAVVSNSYSQNEWMHRNLPTLARKFKVILNGVARELISVSAAPISRDGCVSFVLLGRVSYQKAPDILVEAIKLLPAEIRSRSRFEWYGEDDPESPGLRKKLEEIVSRDVLPLTFHRATKDVVSVLEDAEAFILCSRFEGTPNVLLEAMARGKFVIATRVSDVPRILGESERGLLCDVESQSLADSIVKFISLSDERVAMTMDRALLHVKENFSSEVMAESYLSALGLV